MSLFDIFNSVKYEKQISKIKEEHFERVAGKEDTIHELKLNVKELESKISIELKEQEHKYKLQVQEIEAASVTELAEAKHALGLEKERWGVEKERIETKHERELNKKMLNVEKEVFVKLKDVVEREAKAQGLVVDIQGKLLDRMVSVLPDTNIQIGEATPSLRIENVKKKKK